ncbi:TolC family protein [Filimonas lacunae]|nr:TolC family protein [Filimonas lacunae]BAV07490.1 outer membrane efflux protein precursor [Filimonas lacunae]
MKSQYIILVLFTAAFTARGQALNTTDTSTIHYLGQVWEQAIQHNPTQAIYQQQLQQAVYNSKAAKGVFYPNASAAFNATDNLHLGVTPIPGEIIDKPGTTYYAQFGKTYNYNTGVTVTQNLFNWTSVMQSKIAQSNVELSRLQQQQYQQTLKEQAARLYFTALIAQNALQINKADKALADSLQVLAWHKLQEGTSDLLASNQATINVNNIIQNQAQSQQLYHQSIANLKVLLGQQPASELVLTEALSIDSLVALPVPQAGPDHTLDVFSQQIQIANMQRRQQRAAAYPVIGATGYFGSQQYRNDFGLTFGKDDWHGYRYIGLNVSVPLFTGFTNSNKYKSAQVQQQIAQLQYDTARLRSETNDLLQVKNYNDYLQMVKSAADNFHLYGDNLQLNQQKYLEGVIAMDVYIKAFQDYLTAENTYLNNLSLLLSTRATLLSRQ